MPTNGGAYNCLLNSTSKNIAAIAGTTTILSYIATAVISGEDAVQYLYSIIHIPIIPVTILLLLVFALLVISGIKDSAKVALGIFCFHICVLIIFLALGFFYFLHGGHSYLAANLTATMPILKRLGGILPALFFGFSASLLGVSGFESSANFVEEQQRGVFRKTLRNMLIGVAIFNPLTALIALNVLPFQEIIKSEDFLLSRAAQIIGGNLFAYILVGDAFLVLAGAVLTAFVGVGGLIYRMTTDGCFPEFLAKETKRKSYPYIVIGFFVLCTSILLLTKGNLLSLAGVYTIAFLGVMSMFAFGNLLMRETRKDLKRTYQAPVLFVLLALFSTAAGIIGNVRLNPINLNYFSTYFFPAIVVVFFTIYLDYFLQIVLRFSKNRLPKVYKYITGRFAVITSGTYIVFFHHLARLHQILEYLDKNEMGKTIYLIHCNNNDPMRPNRNPEKFAELKRILPVLKRAGVYPYFNIIPVYKNKPFGPRVITEVSKEFNVKKNRILIGSIHHEHQFDYDDLGGVRIIF